MILIASGESQTRHAVKKKKILLVLVCTGECTGLTIFRLLKFRSFQEFSIFFDKNFNQIRSLILFMRMEV